MQKQHGFKKRNPNVDAPCSPKARYERGGCSQGVRPTFSTWGKKHFRECLDGSNGFFSCGKDFHKVIHSPTIEPRQRQSRKSTSEGTITIPLSRCRFSTLQANK